MFDITHEGRTTLATNIGEARSLGYPDAAIASALRKEAKTRALREIERYRQRLAGVEAGVDRPGPERVGIWGAKARLARAYKDRPDDLPDDAPGFFKSHLSREATAKGRSLGQQLKRIAFKADTFEGLGFLIDGMEAEAEAGLAAVTDEQGLAGGFEAYLAQAQRQADQAFANAIAALAA